MPHEIDKIRISLFGSFRIEGPCGTDLTPKSSKGQGLLALLATEKHFRRSRTWLQDKLWSDRAQPQGAASLRQALAEIRKSFGPYADAFYTDRRVVTLDTAKVCLHASNFDQTDTAEFLEGIDVRDMEFEEWLCVMRSRYADGLLPADKTPTTAETSERRKPLPRTIIIVAANEFPASLRIVEDHLIDSISKSMRELFSVDILYQMPDLAKPGMLLVTIQAFELKDTHLGLRATIEDVDSHRALWSESMVTEHEPSPISQSIEHLGLSHRLLNALSQALSSDPAPLVHDRDANFLAGRALSKMFSMRHDALTDAERLLEKASEIEPRGIFHAWRAQLAVIQYIERQECFKPELLEKSIELSTRAMAAEPLNSNVLCAVANARLILENNIGASSELARMSVEVNPANPLAWWSLANTKLYAGNVQDAYTAAKVSQRLSDRSPFRFWSDFQVSLIAAVTNRTDEAILFGELSSSLAPNFRPPMRYLTALYAKRGERKDAARKAARLKQLEPDFSISRMTNDIDYPVSMMRKSGLLDLARLSEIEL